MKTRARAGGAMKRPKSVSEEQFKNAQDGQQRAHSGLGIAYFRRKDFDDSVKELQIAVKEEAPEVDPTDLYITSELTCKI